MNIPSRIRAGTFIGIFSGILVFPSESISRGAASFQRKEASVVANPEIPLHREAVLDLKEDLSLGAAAKGEAVFSQVRTIVVDDAENIYVLDGKDILVRAFDKRGRFLRTIGKKGQGPGELNGALWLSLNPAAGELMIQDLGNRLAYFSPEGTFLRSGFVRERLGQPKVRVDLSGNLVVFGGILGTPGSHFTANKEFHLKKLGPDGNLRDIVGIFPGHGDFSAYDPALTVYWDIDPKGNVVFGYPAKYEIGIFGPDGNLVKRITRKFKPVRMTGEEKERIVESIPPQTRETLNIKVADEHVAFGGLFLDDRGWIYVQSWERADSERFVYDVFDAEGRFFGRAPLPRSPILMKKNKLYTIEEDKDGYPLVKRYGVTWRVPQTPGAAPR